MNKLKPEYRFTVRCTYLEVKGAFIDLMRKMIKNGGCKKELKKIEKIYKDKYNETCSL